MAHPDPQKRRQYGRIGANKSWAQTPIRSERTAPARRGLEERFEREVDAADPDGQMSPEDRAKAIANKRAEHYQRMSRAGVEARRRKRAA